MCTWQLTMFFQIVVVCVFLGHRHEILRLPSPSHEESVSQSVKIWLCVKSGTKKYWQTNKQTIFQCGLDHIFPWLPFFVGTTIALLKPYHNHKVSIHQSHSLSVVKWSLSQETVKLRPRASWHSAVYQTSRCSGKEPALLPNVDWTRESGGNRSCLSTWSW